MDTLETVINNYLEYCNSQKCLDEKTLKAYRIDLRQFSEQISIINITEITPKTLVYWHIDIWHYNNFLFGSCCKPRIQ